MPRVTPIDQSRSRSDNPSTKTANPVPKVVPPIPATWGKLSPPTFSQLSRLDRTIIAAPTLTTTRPSTFIAVLDDGTSSPLGLASAAS